MNQYGMAGQYGPVHAGSTTCAVGRDQLEVYTSKGWRLHAVVSETRNTSPVAPPGYNYGGYGGDPKRGEPVAPVLQTTALFVLERSDELAKDDARVHLEAARIEIGNLQHTAETRASAYRDLERKLAEAVKEAERWKEIWTKHRADDEAHLAKITEARAQTASAEAKLKKITKALGEERLAEIMGPRG